MATKRLLSLLGSVLVCAPGVAFSDNDTRLVDCTKGHSIQKAIAAHDSPGYQEALRALGDGAERDLRIVEGVS